MSVEFRQRTPGEYAKIIWKRKWLIILPTIAVATAVGWVVSRLPNIYESSTLIVVKPATFSAGPTIGEDNITRQLNSITHVVTSRSSLEPLVQRYGLYNAERANGLPMEVVINNIRQDIKVEVNTTRNDITDGFNIKFRGRDPRTTQAVTAELASKYIDEQTKATVNATTSAKQFIDQQTKQAKDELDAIDKQRLEFMQGNISQLPSAALTLVGQLSSLREQQKAYIAEIGRHQDRRSALTGQLALMKKTSDDIREEIVDNTTDPKTTLGWAELVKRKADLEAQLQRMLTELRPKHPDVIAQQAQIESVKKEMDAMLGEREERIKQRQEKLRARPDLVLANLESEIRLIDGEIKRKQKTVGDFDKQIGELSHRLNTVPGVEVALGALDREYQTKKAAYDALLQQQQRITLGDDAAKQQQGETIQVIDPANLPAQPVAPKRFTLFAMGLMAGLGFGLLLAGVFEVPRLLTIQSREDAAHYTGLPVLVVVPELLTAREARAIPWRRRLLLAAGIAATIVSIPLLALALRASQVVELLMSGRA
jgi:succinoglycan biosynthesis transport protein ExoP